MTRVPTTEAVMDARKTAPHSMPDPDRIDGATMIMYAIEKNVVRPAMTSRPRVVSFSLRRK